MDSETVERIAQALAGRLGALIDVARALHALLDSRMGR
jgi:hypothetical protein